MSLQQCYTPLDTIDDIDITLTYAEEDVLLLTTSLEQHYSPVHNNDFCNNDDAINNTKADNICVELYNSMRGTHFNSPVDDKGISYSNISINAKDKRQYDTPINNRDNRPISLMVCLKRNITVDHLVSLTLILLSDLVAPHFARSCNFDDISMSKLFNERNELLLELHKVALREKFDFEIEQSTTTCFKADYSLESCKWRI